MALKVLHSLAHNSDAPYFEWFAEAAQVEGSPEFSFLFLVTPATVAGTRLAKFGVTCHSVAFDASKRASSMIRSVVSVWALLRRVRPDVVQAHLFDDAVPVLVAAWLARVPVRVLAKEDTAVHWANAPKWMWLDRLNNALATDIVTISSESREFVLVEERAAPKKETLIPHGIPLNDYPTQPKSLIDSFRLEKGWPNRIVVGTVSRFVKSKGHHSIVEAVQRLVVSFPELLFVFVGDGPEQDAISKLIEERGLGGHIRLLGWVERAQMPLLYASLDVFLHAATMEPFGFVIAEAMASGVSVVSTKTGAALDVIDDGVHGILVTEQTGVAIADALERCLNLGPTGRAALGTAAKRAAEEHFSVTRMFGSYCDLYESAAARHRKWPRS